MATYVNDLRLTELATGEGSGTWGVTTNTNLELIGEALGYGTQDCFASDADATTTVADGATDPARAMYFKVTSSATLTATRTLTIAPNTMTRVMLIENATTGSQSIAISQGSGGNVTIASGQVKMVYLDGAGAGAAVVDAMASLELGTITVANLTATTADINGGTIDGATIGGASAAAGTFTTLNATGGGSLTGTWSDLGTVTTVDINGGTIDGTDITVGSGKTLDVSAGTFTVANDQISGDAINGGTATPTTLTSTTVNATTVDTTNIEVTNLKAKDGTAAGSIADSTGVVTLSSSVLTTTDINGGTIDGVTIGGASAGAGTFTTLQADTSLNVDGTVTSDGLTVDGSSVLDSAAGGDVLTLKSNAGVNHTLTFQRGVSDAGTITASFDGIYTNGSQIQKLQTGGTDRILINASGNISFYEDTGTNARIFYDADAQFVINEDSADFDFRVESDSNTHMLFVDAGNSRVGINTSSPDTALDVNGTVTADKLDITVGGASFEELIALTNASTSFAAGVKISASFDSDTQEYGNLTWSPRNASNGYFTINNLLDGSLVKALEIDGNDISFYDPTGTNARIVYNADSAFVINQDSADFDFRVESDNNTHMLFVDAGNDTVVIGSGTISAPATYDFLSYNASADGRSAFVHGSGDGGIVVSGSAGSSAASVIFGNNWGANGATFTEEWRLYMNGVDDSLNFNYSANAATAMQLTSGGTMIYNYAAIFNESGGDNDFRVESDTNTHMLFVDAGNNEVGVGTNNPESTLHVYGNLTVGKAGVTGSWDVKMWPAVAGRSVMGFKNIDNYTALLSGDPLSTELFTVTTGGRGNFKGGLTVNDNGDPAEDFRVESDNNTHMLFVDAGNDRVGIGTSSPSEALAVDGAVEIGGNLSSGAKLIRKTSSNYDLEYQVGSTLVSSGEAMQLTFTCGGIRRSAVIEITIAGSWTPSNTGSNHPAAKYIMRVLTNDSGVSTINGPTVIYEFGFSSATDFTFTSLGSSQYRIDLANVLAQNNVNYTYNIKVINAASTGHTLTSAVVA